MFQFTQKIRKNTTIIDKMLQKEKNVMTGYKTGKNGRITGKDTDKRAQN